ncbi:G protein-activated inward rectifier potassium channel 4 [Halotydeus destructor]|nr:G protein-activated inward rectifier potassium channel 4 [Halotydeus destructor]
MKTYAEADGGAWQELLPSSTSGSLQVHLGGHSDTIAGRQPAGEQIVIELPEKESPTSTVTAEHGKQLYMKIKQQQQSAANSLQYNNTMNKNLSWTSGGSGRFTAMDPGMTVSSVQKYSMKQTKIFPGKVRKRVVQKNGYVNLFKERVEKRHQRYLQDTFTTMVDIQWRWNLLVFALGFILSWLGFAMVWYVICYAHGDFEHAGDDKWTPCVAEVTSFASAFLFSIETQHTIGYGTRATTEECPEAIFVMCLQSITGVMIQCFVVGFVFAKLSRPQKRSQTLMFSKSAIICQRDGKLCLMFRIGDVRNRSHIIGPSISAIVISRKTTLEGEVIPYFHTQLECKFDHSTDNIFLIWPATMVHVIDEASPFYHMSCEDMMREKYEIIAVLEGTIESTGQTVQARSSYLPCEVLWGHRFEQLVRYKRESGEYRVDYSKFNNTYEVDTPSFSAKELYEMQRYTSQNSPFPRVSPTSEYSSSKSDNDKSSEGGLTANNLTVRSFTNRHPSGRSALEPDCELRPF